MARSLVLRFGLSKKKLPQRSSLQSVDLCNTVNSQLYLTRIRKTFLTNMVLISPPFVAHKDFFYHFQHMSYYCVCKMSISLDKAFLRISNRIRNVAKAYF